MASRYESHKRRMMSLVLDEIIAVMRKHRPNLLLSLNGGPEAFPNNVIWEVASPAPSWGPATVYRALQRLSCSSAFLHLQHCRSMTGVH